MKDSLHLSKKYWRLIRCW